LRAGSRNIYGPVIQKLNTAALQVRRAADGGRKLPTFSDLAFTFFQQKYDRKGLVETNVASLECTLACFQEVG
jgi:hypothetical protein